MVTPRRKFDSKNLFLNIDILLRPLNTSFWVMTQHPLRLKEYLILP